MSALLHALSALNTSTFKPGVTAATSDDDEDEAAVPCTSQPCVWKQPKKRKESNLRLSDASFEKHEYAKPVKRKIRLVEDFDLRPELWHNLGYLICYRRSKGNNCAYPFYLTHSFSVNNPLTTMFLTSRS